MLTRFVTGEGALYGVDINTGGIADSFANFVWEPAVVKVFPVILILLFFLVVNFDLWYLYFGYDYIYHLLQINAINAATEAACLILSVDETVKNPKVVWTLCLVTIFFQSTPYVLHHA